MKKTAIVFFIIFFSFSILTGAESEDHFLTLKASARYPEALDILIKETMQSESRDEIEINLLRFEEMMSINEFNEKILDSLEKTAELKVFQKNLDLKNKSDILKNRIYLKFGRLKDSESISKKIFSSEFNIIGPFRNSTIQDFEKQIIDEKTFLSSEKLKGKNYYVSRFVSVADPTGIVDISDYMPDTADSFYYLEKSFNVSSGKTFRLYFGKTGFTDIYLDGKIIFSNRKKHGFHYDQYQLKVYMEPGNHRLIIKTGDSSSGIKFSLRAEDEFFSPIQFNKPSDGPFSGSRLEYSGNSPIQDHLHKKNDLNSKEKFLAGYMLYIYELNRDDNEDIVSVLSGISQESIYYPHAFYYLGRSESNIQQKEDYYKKSSASDVRFVESLAEQCEIKINNKSIYDASEIIETISHRSRASLPSLRLKAQLYISKGWDMEAFKASEAIRYSGYFFTAADIESKIHFERKDFLKSEKILKGIFSRNRNSRDHLNLLLKSIDSSGKYSEEIDILNDSIQLFPANVYLRLMIAELIQKSDSVSAGIPYLSSAQKISPNNRDTLFKLGIAYHQIGKKGLARYYLSQASFFDPENHNIKRYLNLLENMNSKINDKIFKDDISKLNTESESFRNEPAVMLLNESVTDVNEDGSFTKYIRRIYRINDRSVFNDFKHQYIIYDPQRESVENIRCSVINAGSSIDMNDMIKKSISDPESRLYYDLEAIIIPVNLIQKGSILDIKYVVKNRSGEEYKGYYGDKYLIGGLNRILFTRILLIRPKSKAIYFHKKGISDKETAVEEDGGSIVTTVTVKNSLPVKEESAMPNSSEFLPAVYFTSHRDWNQFYIWYSSLLKDKIRLNEEMKKDISGIVSETDSQLEKVRKIYAHVTKKIRYVGFEIGLGGIQPRSCDLTYQTKMGDCKDVSIVLAAMLRGAGIDARLALVRTRDKGRTDYTVPIANDFNHAICYVNLNGGFFLDGTAKNSAYDELPSDDRGVSAMVIGDKGYFFTRTDSQLYQPNVEKVYNEIKISESGDAMIERKLVKQGIFASSTRKNLRNSEKNLSSISEYWNKKYQGSKIESIKVISSDDYGPASYSYTVTVPQYCQSVNNDFVFQSSIGTSDYYSDFTLLKTRSLSMVMSDKRRSEVSSKYIPPEGYSFYKIPKNEKYEDKKFSADFKFYSESDGLRMETVIEIKDFSIESDEYERFRNFSRFVHRKETEKLILVKKKITD